MKIGELIYSIKIKDMVLPEFQREYVWSKDQAKKLFSSLVRDYPVGSLLFWKTDSPPELKNVHTLKQSSTYQIILDGQQRLTTLYMLITGNIPPYYTKEDITTDPRDLFFNIDSGEFQYFLASIMSNDPLWVRVIDCFNSDKDIDVFKIAQTFQDKDIFQLANKFLNNLTKIRGILDKDLPMQLVPTTANIEDAIDIFDLVNSQGTKLTDAELALTHVVGKWPQARRVIKEKIDYLNNENFHFGLSFMTRSLTTVVSQRALYESIHSEPKDKLLKGWSTLSKILDYLVSILPQRAFIHSTYDLNTTNVLIPLVAYLSQHSGKFPDEKSLNRALHFMYIALTWARYSGQTDQKLEYDVSIMFRENNPWEKLVDALIDQRGRIEVKPNDLEGRTASHPLYLITYILAKSQGAIDWFNGIPLTGKQAGAYYVHSHHIFPSSVLYKNGYDIENHLHRKIVNEIANRAFLTADSNLGLSNELPEKYLPEIESKYPGSLIKQFIPIQPELWKVERYADFLEARRHLISLKINDYFKSLISKPITFKEKPLVDIINLGESATLEFKSTLQWDMVKNEKNKALRKSVLKTVSAFLNSDGGTLVIGVEDDGAICGLLNDLLTTENSEDKFLNLVNTLIYDSIGPEFAALIKTRLESIEHKKVCVLEIDRSLLPAYLTLDGHKEFYVRMNNTSRSLDPEETVKYINQNWS
jgi:hypothetical protein